jgi:hypothetical protein
VLRVETRTEKNGTLKRQIPNIWENIKREIFSEKSVIVLAKYRKNNGIKIDIM